MTLLYPKTLIAVLLGVVICFVGEVPAEAQWRSSGHFDYQPGHYDRHGSHYDYHPGTIRYHQDSNTHHDPHHYPTRRYSPSQSHTVRRGTYDSGHHPSVPAHQVVRYEFGAFSHVDHLAQQLEREANLLCLELHHNYQHNPGFQETYREAYEILATTRFLHGLEHSGNRDKLRSVAGELDKLFHHVEGDFAGWTPHRHRHVSPGGLTTKVEKFEDTLHHLMDDVGVRSSYGSEPTPGSAVAPGSAIAPSAGAPAPAGAPPILTP